MSTTLLLLLCIVVVSSFSSLLSINAFIIPLSTKSWCSFRTSHQPTITSSTILKSSSLAPASDVNDDNNNNNNYNENEQLKNKLLRLCASYDRGFSASPSAKKEVNEIVNQLQSLNPTPINAARGIDGYYGGSDGGDNVETTIDDDNNKNVPLKGIWRMVWTTALDVVNLAASPIATPGAIYQVIEPPIATNVIDFIPRVQSLFPDVFPSSLLRAEVKTRTSRRMSSSDSSSDSNMNSESIEMSNRVGLDFESVKLSPVQVLGLNGKNLPPFNLNFPQFKVTDLNNINIPGVVDLVDPATAPGFFDVIYLDDDMLIIQQNAPGGYFVSIKVSNYDP